MIRSGVIAAIVLVAAPASADDPAPPEPAPPEPAVPEPAPPVVVVPEPAPDPRVDELQQRIDELERRDRTREREVKKLEHGADATIDRVEGLAPIANMISAYLDAGFFYAAGDGSGIRSDTGHLVFDEYRDQVPARWVLMGDPLSTAINARGEPADLGASRALTDDTIDSQGHPGFIANAVGIGIRREVGGGVGIGAHVEILPRGQTARLDVQTAMVGWTPDAAGAWWVAAGKLESVLGVEYKAQDAPDRVTVTPSLACRYTCGRPIGVQVRREDQRSAIAVAVSDGDSFQQTFEPDDRLVSSTLPTLSARASVAIPIAAPAQLWVGASGAIGPQDRQSDDGVTQWHYGLDARLRNFHDVDLTAEFVQGHLPGSEPPDAMPDAAPCALAECLRYKAAYGLAAYRATQLLQPYARIDWRDAVHQHGSEFVYVSDVLRVTAGIRVVISRYAMAKLEYTWNRELGRTPEFPDDVLATSVVVSTE